MLPMFNHIFISHGKKNFKTNKNDMQNEFAIWDCLYFFLQKFGKSFAQTSINHLVLLSFEILTSGLYKSFELPNPNANVTAVPTKPIKGIIALSFIWTISLGNPVILIYNQILIKKYFLLIDNGNIIQWLPPRQWLSLRCINIYWNSHRYF